MGALGTFQGLEMCPAPAFPLGWVAPLPAPSVQRTLNPLLPQPGAFPEPSPRAWPRSWGGRGAPGSPVVREPESRVGGQWTPGRAPGSPGGKRRGPKFPGSGEAASLDPAPSAQGGVPPRSPGPAPRRAPKGMGPAVPARSQAPTEDPPASGHGAARPARRAWGRASGRQLPQRGRGELSEARSPVPEQRGREGLRGGLGSQSARQGRPPVPPQKPRPKPRAGSLRRRHLPSASWECAAAPRQRPVLK